MFHDRVEADSPIVEQDHYLLQVHAVINEFDVLGIRRRIDDACFDVMGFAVLLSHNADLHRVVLIQLQ